MKRIRLRNDLFNGNEKISTATILRLIVGSSPHKSLTVDEIRRRVHILDALDACAPQASYVLLEDDEHKVLAAAIEGFPWSAASKGLLTIIDDVLQAEPARETSPAMSVVEKPVPTVSGPPIIGAKERA